MSKPLSRLLRREQFAFLARDHSAWGDHLDRVRAFLGEGLQSADPGRPVLILGAGSGLEVPWALAPADTTGWDGDPWSRLWTAAAPPSLAPLGLRGSDGRDVRIGGHHPARSHGTLVGTLAGCGRPRSSGWRASSPSSFRIREPCGPGSGRIDPAPSWSPTSWASSAWWPRESWKASLAGHPGIRIPNGRSPWPRPWPPGRPAPSRPSCGCCAKVARTFGWCMTGRWCSGVDPWTWVPGRMPGRASCRSRGRPWKPVMRWRGWTLPPSCLETGWTSSRRIVGSGPWRPASDTSSRPSWFGGAD